MKRTKPLDEAAKDRRGIRGLLMRFGAAGFLFFLVKGLAWLIVPMLWIAAQ